MEVLVWSGSPVQVRSMNLDVCRIGAGQEQRMGVVARKNAGQERMGVVVCRNGA